MSAITHAHTHEGGTKQGNEHRNIRGVVRRPRAATVALWVWVYITIYIYRERERGRNQERKRERIIIKSQRHYRELCVCVCVGERVSQLQSHWNGCSRSSINVQQPPRGWGGSGGTASPCSRPPAIGPRRPRGSRGLVFAESYSGWTRWLHTRMFFTFTHSIYTTAH